ncbi:hypothetical protein JCM21714_4570 [Gracilibacillus boraciitolerans JCM 21714]|uniref:HTH cro/C1-type domain-containing protein n=1 Tax=Gracilibacillus boraciitolerans JCM 21714 TaxID=1298598 RepID=W4VQW7_9BACI|nr:helix-turn-helix transcriptional regulator [Gracilibacillus boraciitolerans]GAE95344.1 hypothetical protein JCM21714_4570 [Gracilibacillus boraciitolerans JCM 21714]
MNERENDDFKVVVGEYFKKQRLTKNYTQDDIAHALDLSDRWVQKFVSGEIDISLSRFEQIAHLLDVPYYTIHTYFQEYAFSTYQDRVNAVNDRKARKKK